MLSLTLSSGRKLTIGGVNLSLVIYFSLVNIVLTHGI